MKLNLSISRPVAQDLLRWSISANILIVAFRWLVVGCQAATLLITWPLWEVHASPPMLPALPLPPFDLGPLLLLSLLLILIAPKPGIIVHTVIVLYAMIIDQTRIQPEIVSLIFLLWGTLPNPNAKALARAHLISLWLFAGINKLLSPAFLHGTAQWILAGLVRRPPAWLENNIGYVIALTEFGTGVLAIFPRTRKLAGIVAFGLHIGILVDLSPLGHGWNQSVWPWNLALALAGFALISPWQESPLRSLAQCNRLVRPLIVLLVIAPAGFYVGVTDAYLAHNLYSSNVPTASSTALSPNATWDAFNVPLPPEHRLFEQYFRLTCSPGDKMTIEDTRWWFRRQGLEEVHLTCPTSP
jgi:hypothetical protein